MRLAEIFRVHCLSIKRMYGNVRCPVGNMYTLLEHTKVIRNTPVADDYAGHVYAIGSSLTDSIRFAGDAAAAAAAVS